MSNTMTVVGNIGRDPEYRNLPKGGEVMSFSVADNRPDGSVRWFNVSLFNPNHNFTDHLKKGSSVVVTGIFSDREYTDSNGNNKLSLDITAFDRGVSFAGSRAKSNDADAVGSDDVPF